jgi:hypothetical protein
MGIEPTPSAWKAEVLPLNYTRLPNTKLAINYAWHYNATRPWWRGEDSNLRRLSRQIYSLIPLTAWVPLRNQPHILG